jgi:hypothetical protein
VPYSVTPTGITTANHGTDGTITWDVATCPSTNYHIVWGYGSGLSSWTLGGGKCAIGTSGTYGWTGMPDPSGDASRFLWYAVVGNNGGTTEGSWGAMTGGAERGGAAASGVCGMTTKDTTTACGTP